MAKKTYTILIVDDNPTNLNVLLEYLDKQGFKVLIAEDGEKAIERANLSKPDLILLDILMPGIDGYETCKRLKENPETKDISIIFMTALFETENKIMAFKAGGVDYITKPFQDEELLARVNTHLTIQKQRDELTLLNETKDKFFSIVSHDMRGLVSPMVGLSDVLMRLAANLKHEKLIKITTMIHNSIMNTMKLMEDLLSWGRLQRKIIEPQFTDIDINSIAANIIKLNKPKADQKKIKLINTIPEKTRVHMDPNMIETVLRNFVSNALKFTREKGEITLSSQDIDDNKVKISVSDTGVGISEENIHKLFKIGEKFKKQGTSGEKGTGLGLILCKDLIEKNNGDVFIESKVGKGSVFSFTLQKAQYL